MSLAHAMVVLLVVQLQGSRCLVLIDAPDDQEEPASAITQSNGAGIVDEIPEESVRVVPISVVHRLRQQPGNGRRIFWKPGLVGQASASGAQHHRHHHFHDHFSQSSYPWLSPFGNSHPFNGLFGSTQTFLPMGQNQGVANQRFPFPNGFINNSPFNQGFDQNISQQPGRIPEPAEPHASGVQLSRASYAGCGMAPGTNSAVTLRVIGGKEALAHSWPFAVALRLGRALCGGTLIRPDVVVTAAHCITESRRSIARVVVGAHNIYRVEPGTESLRVIQIIPHPQYNAAISPPSHDIALLRLERPVAIDARKQTACLPAAGQTPSPGTRCFIVGWGGMSRDETLPERLQQAMLPIISRNECSRFFPGKLGPQMICAGTGRSDTCGGDSGGPLVCKSGSQWVLTGVTSWGDECGRRFPGVYTKVADYSEWIAQQLASMGRL